MEDPRRCGGVGARGPDRVVAGVPGSLVGECCCRPLQGVPWPRHRPHLPQFVCSAGELARGEPHRRHPARGDGGRDAAGRWPRSSRWSGRTRRGRRLQRVERSARRAVGVAPGSHAGPVGRRRAARDLLLRRRAGTQTRVRRRRLARPAQGRTARRRCGRRDGRPCADLRRLQRRGGWGRACRLGDPDRHRHRLRTRRAGGDQHPPAWALRTFLLTLAVVDDLLAITIIAVFYTDSLTVLPLLLALVPLALFAVLVQRRVRSGWLLLPLAVATWVLVHESGVHATVAGVVLGFTVPVRRRAAGPGPGLAEHFEHRWRPLSAGFAVPVFAFFAAGVSLTGAGGLGASLTDSITLGIIVGLVAGKTVGVARLHLAGPAVHPRPARRGPELVGRPRARVAGRDRVHRLAAHRRTRLRRRHPPGRPGQDRSPRSDRCCPRCSRPSCCASATGTTAASAPRRTATATPTASPTSTRPATAQLIAVDQRRARSAQHHGP